MTFLRALQVFAFIFWVSCPIQAWSVDIGFAGALNVTNAVTKTSARDVTADSYLGYGAGLFVEGKPFISSSLSTEIGALYLQRIFGYGTAAKFTTTWLAVPLLERLSYGSFSIGVGGYYASAIGEIKVDDDPTAGTSYSANSLNTSDYGWAASLRWNPGNLFADLRYQSGLKNVSTKDNVDTKFTDMLLLLGLRF